MSDSATMKAWQVNAFGGQIEDNLFLNNTATRPRSTLLPDEVLVQVMTAGINPVDYKLAELKATKLMISIPASPGLDFCGRVVSSGTAVDSLRTGELVFGRLSKPTQFGTLGEYIITTVNDCILLPSGLSPDHAAAVGTAGLTAYQCVSPNVQGKGAKVLINGGSGGTGIFAIQIAKALGCSVTTTCSTNNVSLCKDLGADVVIDYRNSDVVAALKSEGLVYDLVVDNVGTPSDLYVASTEFLKPDGKFVQVGANFGMGSLGGVMSRMLKPSFLGGGKRKFQFLNCSNDTTQLNQLANVSVNHYVPRPKIAHDSSG